MTRKDTPPTTNDPKFPDHPEPQGPAIPPKK